MKRSSGRPTHPGLAMRDAFLKAHAARTSAAPTVTIPVGIVRSDKLARVIAALRLESNTAQKKRRVGNDNN